MMHRKLRKLIRQPRAFFMDSPPALLIRRVLKLSPPLTPAGDNWRSGTAPVAIMLGFLPWKREIAANYLQEFRTLFAEVNVPVAAYADKLLSYNPLCIIIWGYNDPADVTAFAARHGLPIYRMEDGFLRSVSLGSTHSRPYSLVLDKSSLYFNAEEQSDLEKLLATYDFTQAPELLQRAEQLIAFQREFGISKYNLPSEKESDIKNQVARKRCILVIGQVENDKSIVYGQGNGWTCARLIQLACEENPDCEIIYKPHPDVMHGIRTGNAPLGPLPSRCRIAERDESLAELFTLVERVYVITSLSGFEALIHGLPVTTAGMPFYAGWGLTDDRCPDHHRSRRLTLAELYAAAYLLYPRYILNLQNSPDGCRKTLFKLCEEKNGIELLGSNWESGGRPVALLCGVSPQTSGFLSASLTGYRVARLRQENMDIIRICQAMNVRAIFTESLPLPESVIRQARQERIELVAIERGFACAVTSPEADAPGTLILRPLSETAPMTSDHHTEGLIRILSEFSASEHADQIAGMKTLLPLNRLLARILDGLALTNPSRSLLPLKKSAGARVLLLSKTPDEARKLKRLARQDHPAGEFLVISESAESAAPAPVISPDTQFLPASALQQALDSVDCVYTEDSLYALEALRSELPVIVSGRPFYAGWGLTKDLQPVERPRHLSREQFFYALYALHPRYLCSPQDALTGFFSTSMELAVRQLTRVIDGLTFGFSIEKNSTLKPGKDVPYKTLFQSLRELCHDPGWHMLVICLLWSFGNAADQAQLLNWAEKNLPAEILPDFLLILMQAGKTDVRWRLANAYIRAGRSREAQLLLDELQGQEPENSEEKKSGSPAPAMQLARFLKANHEAKQSREQYLIALARGEVSLETLEELAETLMECMDFESSAALNRLLYSLAMQNKRNALAARSLTGIVAARACAGNIIEAMLWLALLSKRNINEAIRAGDIIQTFWVREFPGINIHACIQAWTSDGGTLEQRAKLRMFASEFEEAIQLMDANIQEVSDSLPLSQLYARIKFFLGEYDEADRSYAYIMRKFGLSPSICYNYLYFCMHAGRYAQLDEMLHRCGRMHIANKDYFRESVGLSQRKIEGNFPVLCDLDTHREMRRLLGDKCVRSLDEVHEGERLLVVACSGLGDEVGDAVFYQRIVERCSGQTTITCDPRLYHLLARSLPDVHFEPVHRLRYVTDLASFAEEFTALPSSAFIFMFDSHGYDLFRRTDKVILAMDAVRSVVRGYEDLSGLARLKADEKLVHHYRAQLPDDGKLNVGLCWRSANKRYSRARSYCPIEEFTPLLQRNDVRFVLLQYDGCSPQESAWLEKEFPGKTLSFEGLDMFRDLDGLAAAIASLDLVISPAVNIRQFSGSIGIPTSLLVSGASQDWRKDEYGDRDLIYSGTVHRKIDAPDNLMASLQRDISEALERKSSGASGI